MVLASQLVCQAAANASSFKRILDTKLRQPSLLLAVVPSSLHMFTSASVQCLRELVEKMLKAAVVGTDAKQEL
jgi:hypothetical protein